MICESRAPRIGAARAVVTTSIPATAASAPRALPERSALRDGLRLPTVVMATVVFDTRHDSGTDSEGLVKNARF